MASGTDPKDVAVSSGKTPYDSDQDKRPDVQTDTDTPSAGEVQDELTYQYSNSRKLGIISSAFVIFNKMVGTGSSTLLLCVSRTPLTLLGIFSTPSGVFAASGSVGVSLFLWIIGGILTFAGLSAFMEFGLAVSSFCL